MDTKWCRVMFMGAVSQMLYRIRQLLQECIQKTLASEQGE